MSERNIENIIYNRIPNLKIFVNEISYVTPHLHLDYELGLVLEGESEFIVSGNAYNLIKGDLILVNPNELHEIRTKLEDAVFLFIQFKESVFSSVLHSKEIILFGERVLNLQAENKYNNVVDSISNLARVYFEDSDTNLKFDVIGVFYQFIFELLKTVNYRFVEDKQQASNDKNLARLNNFLRFCNDNYKHSVSLSVFAESEDLSLSYASRFVKNQMGISFQEHIRNLRFEEAKSLLKNERISLTEVAYESGFTDLRYMQDLFKEKLNVTASEYRDNYAKLNNIDRFNSKELSKENDIENILSFTDALEFFS